jgi:hypothetical protein
VARALAVAEALVDLRAVVELELVRGSLTPAEAERATALGVRPVTSGSMPVPDMVAIVDLPLLEPTVRRFDPDRLVVFDDRDTFAGRAAIVVQPSRPAWSGRGAPGRVLAGYGYCPIGAVYRRLRAVASSGAPPDATAARLPIRLVVCFGGADPASVTERVASAVRSDDAWTTEVIVGASYTGRTDCWSAAPIRDPADLPERLATADLVVVGAGTMKFEVACLGRPAIILAVADDQLMVGPQFAATGAATYLGDGRTIDPARVRAAIADLAGDAARRQAMGRVAALLIDGHGADRIAAATVALTDLSG